MVFKVLYQDSVTEVPVRERTQSMYLQADSVREVREHLIDRSYNIEYIQILDEAHLQFEKQSEFFQLENMKS